MQISHIVVAVVLIFALVWIFLAIALSQLPDDNESTPGNGGSIKVINRFVTSITTKYRQDPVGDNSIQHDHIGDRVVVPRETNLHRKFIDQPIVPNRVVPPLPILAPAPMSEVERNMSLYLHTLHSRLSAIAGPTVTALKAWDTFMDVTKEMPMKWDQENRDRFVITSIYRSIKFIRTACVVVKRKIVLITSFCPPSVFRRFPEPRSDGSIFVSLGTYRDPFCPMTIKSLYENARYVHSLTLLCAACSLNLDLKCPNHTILTSCLFFSIRHPDRLFVGMFQQNCFGPKCRTGVLVGGNALASAPALMLVFCNLTTWNLLCNANSAHFCYFNFCISLPQLIALFDPFLLFTSHLPLYFQAR